VDTLRQRTGFLFAAFFVLLVLAVGRTAYLGLIRAGALRRAASTQQLTKEEVMPPRGTITDRNGVELAVSEPADDVSADPFLLHDPLAVAQKLAPLLGEKEGAVLRKLSEPRGFVYLRRALPSSLAKQIIALRVPGIDATPVMRRVYPRGTLAAQLLGFVGTEGAGLAGLEASWNTQLGGRPGDRHVISDARGQPVSISETTPVVRGHALTLTVDANIQQRTEDVLAAVGRVFNPKDATAIVMDPHSGAVLALASWPQVNLAEPASAAPGALEDRAVSFDYEPGSTFKVITVSGALQQGLITPETPFNVPDQIHVADRTIHDDTEHGEETLTTSQILARSSNVGAIKIGALEGAPTFNSWVRRFGFGTPSGVGLPHDEQGLVLPLAKYSGSSMGNLPIGQGELVTPMQMAAAYAAVANGGTLRAPHLVAAIDGKPTSLPHGRRIISSTVAAQVRHMLEGVLATGGTASEVSIPGYQLAGKTGTASKIDPATGEYSKTAYVASFIGFAPASNPKLLCAVVVDEPQNGSIYGGQVAAPAFGEIMSFALPYMGVPAEGSSSGG
jgi:cell division protein FtsI/penicillin-binding protein 2